eukprot:512295_1
MSLLTILTILWNVGHSLINKPNIFFILVDDLGFGNVGWNNPNNKEINTPSLNNLALNEGLILNRHYVHYVCTPSRSSFQSGRLPVHITTEGPPGIYNNYQTEYFYKEFPDPNSGLPQNITCIASKLKLASYSTHIIGKWDIGWASDHHLPKGRGYDTSMVYLSAMNDYFTQKVGKYGCNTLNISFNDLWGNEEPLYDLIGTNYEEFLFENELNKLIDNFTDQTNPWFLVYTPHLIHAPQQIPQRFLSIYDNDEYNCSQLDTYVYPGFNNSNG